MIENELFQQFGLGAKSDASANNKRTVVYSRVSTKGQEDNTSLANQHEVCMRMVEREGLEVIEEFGGKGESAKAGSARLEYERMLKFVRNPHNRIRYVVFYAYDRFSREGGKAIVTKEQLKQLGIIVKSATMPIDTSNPLGEGMEDMQLIFAKMENDVRRLRCVNGTKAKLRSGEWCGHAPVGYEWKDSRIAIDPVKGPLIRKAFMWKLEEPLISLREIRERLSKRGLSIPKQTMTRIMRNPFYCGLLAHSSLEGELVVGKHEALISKKVFLEVNGILQDKIAAGWRVDEENSLLPLKRFMVCECCGNSLTGYLNKTKAGKPRKRPIPYYKCKTNGCKLSLNADKLGEEFLAELDRYQIAEDLLPLISKELKAYLTHLNADRFKDADVLERRITELDKKFKRLRERYVMEEAIEREDYEEFSKKIQSEKAELSKELAYIRKKSSNPIEQLDKILQNTSNLALIWRNGDYRDKQKVQKMVFPEGMVYSKEKGKVLTPRVNEIIRLSSTISANFGAKNKGQTRSYSYLSHSVAGTGLEPAFAAANISQPF